MQQKMMSVCLLTDMSTGVGHCQWTALSTSTAVRQSAVVTSVFSTSPADEMICRIYTASTEHTRSTNSHAAGAASMYYVM